MRRMLLLLLAACDGGTSEPPPVDESPLDMGPPCSELLPSPEAGQFCLDFNDGTASGWTPEGGGWSVDNGVYVGTAPTLDGASCTASSMMTSMLDDIEARNVRITLDMMSKERADKLIVLRGLDPNNRIEINFRARYTDESAGDLVVQELVDCVQTFHTERFSVPLPHEIEQIIHVEITLLDDSLTVVVDEQQVLNAQFPIADRVGRVGLGVIEGGTTWFDDVIIEVLDPIE
jgi:hypothetical protein